MLCQNTYVDSPVGWGSTYCFTDVRIGVDVLIRVTPITNGTPAPIFFGRHVFCSQGQAVRVFFIRMGFFLILSKIQGGF